MKWREVVGKFIVNTGEEPDPPAERSPSVAAPSAADRISPLGATPSGLSATDFNLSAIYQQEGISPPAFTAEQALEILASLPKELQPATQRQVFKELLRAKGMALGVPLEVIQDDARRKIEVLTASVKSLPEQVAEFVAVSKSEIAGLEEQIQEKHMAIDQAQSQQRQVTQKCQSEIERLTVVLQLLSAGTQTSRGPE
jgi:DNA repair exonuclease SbcCD ATPase subunit